MTEWLGTVVILPIENHQLQRHAQWIYRLASRMSQSRENRQKFKSQITREPKQLRHILAPRMKGWLIGHLLDHIKNFCDVIIT